MSPSLFEREPMIRHLCISILLILFGVSNATCQTYCCSSSQLDAVWKGNGHRYVAIATESPITWYDAQIIATKLGGNLATASSPEENQFIFNLFKCRREFWTVNASGIAHGPWLGGVQSSTALTPDSGWEWIDNSQFVFTNWNPHPAKIGEYEPNDNDPIASAVENHQEDYLHYQYDLSDPNGMQPYWNDIRSNHYNVKSFVVEIPYNSGKRIPQIFTTNYLYNCSKRLTPRRRIFRRSRR